MDINEWKEFVRRYHCNVEFEVFGDGGARAVAVNSEGVSVLVGTYTVDGPVWFAGKGSGIEEVPSV